MNMLADRPVDAMNLALLAAIEDGLPLCERPYARIGHQLQISEQEVIARLSHMHACGIIRRFGLVLQHRPLGYRANAMVVWDVPDEDVDAAATWITSHEYVTLCYCRKRLANVWPYNLYCMIHGQERARVEAQIAKLKQDAILQKCPSRTLFSRRRFKQTGARFSSPSPVERCVP